MTELQPVGDRIVLDPIEDESVTQGGIVLPQSSGERQSSQRANVVAVGSGVLLSNGLRIEPEVKVGDVVVFNRMAGLEIKVNHKALRVVTERDIIGILNLKF